MKILSTIIIILSVTCLACTSGKKERAAATINVDKHASSENIENYILPTDSGRVDINLVNGKGSLTIYKKEDETVYIRFLSEGFNKLSGSLSSPDSLANIRFSQILMPDGSMDGPFGRSVAFDLKADGYYQLSVHENMMAGDPWAGVFKVYIELME